MITTFAFRRLVVSALCGLAASASAQVTPPAAPRPTLPPPKAFAFPTVHSDTLPNGLRFAVVENHELPIVAVRIAPLANSLVDPPGKEGAFALMISALREGTETRTASDITDEAADLGTTLEWNPAAAIGIGRGTPEFITTRSVWERMLALAGDAFIHPAFPMPAVERLRSAQAALAARPPQTVLPTRIAGRILLGEDHPLNAPSKTTEATVSGLTREDLAELHSKYIRPQNTVITVVGDISPAEARAALRRVFGDWKRGGETVRRVAVAPLVTPAPTTIYLRDFPGATQSAIMTAEIVPGRASPDGSAIEATDAILGGGAFLATTGTRLYEALRLRNGLSYGPRSSISWRAEPLLSIWSQTALVPVEKTDSAVLILRDVIREIHGDRPLTADELALAKRTAVGNQATRYETVGQQAGAVADMLVNGLPMTFQADRVRRFQALTLDEFRATAAKYLDPDHLPIIVAGDRAKLEAPLRATGIPVVIVDH